MGQQIELVGIGSGNPDDLTPRAREAILGAEKIAGAPRMLELAQKTGCRAKKRLAGYRADEITAFFQEDDHWTHGCVLLSGDVGFYSGAAGTEAALKRAGFVTERIPGLSSLQLLCARVGIPWENVPVLSLHGTGRDAMGELPGLAAAHPWTFVLPGRAEDLAAAGALLADFQLPDLVFHVGIRLGYPDGKVVTLKAAKADRIEPFDGPFCMLVENPAPCPLSGEIPDEDFVRGEVPMTKEEVRDVILAKLCLPARGVFWDVGAGTGSVSVQAAGERPGLVVYAIEEKDAACDLILKNAARFHAGNIHLVRGHAPEALTDLPAPDAVFIGGSGRNLAEIIRAVLSRTPSCRVVMSFVSLENLTLALTALKDLEIDPEMVQVSVAKSRKAGSVHLLTGQNPVSILSFTGRQCDG